MATLILDTREHLLATTLKALGTPFATAALDVGDVLIQTAEGTPLLIVERKTHADFAASNRDGRYREQRARLMAARGSGIAVLYMLEGVWTSDDSVVFGSTTQGQLKRLTSRLMLRYGLPVLFSYSIQDTAAWCRLFVEQLSEDPTVFQPDSEGAASSAMAGFTASLSLVKKGNKTPAGTATAMLSGIPGLGSKRVEALLATHSIASLVGLSATALGELVVGGKRLGPKLGATIAEALTATT
jgi:ERCC4-type nuclease